MRVVIRKTYKQLSEEAANLVKSRLVKKEDLVLGLATGSTPVGMYEELIRMYKEEGLSFAKVKSFNLDEYYGITGDHPQSYRCFMNDKLFDHINIDKANTYVPDGKAADVDVSCSMFEEKMQKAGGVDLQVLGIGSDGHIGFNEPGSSLASRTRIVALDELTIEDNSRFFEKKEDVPKFAVTMGVGTILEAKELIVLVNGAKKAEVIAKAIEGPITSLISASAIQLHPKVSIFLDEEAANLLARTGYYRFAEQAEKSINKEIF